MKLKPIVMQLRLGATELVGGTDTIVAGSAYFILSGELNGKTYGRFVASSADVAAFATATVRVSPKPFGQNIIGAINLPDVMKDTLTTPCCYVLPIDEEAEENEYAESVNQDITESFTVAVVLSNAGDATGLRAFDQLEAIRTSIFSSLLGWYVPGHVRLISYRGAGVMMNDDRYLVYVFTFESTFSVCPDDGYQDTFPDDLAIINVYMNWNEQDFLTGDAHSLTEGERYVIIGGVINGKDPGAVFIADGDDVTDFTDSSQLVSWVHDWQSIEVETE